MTNLLINKATVCWLFVRYYILVVWSSLQQNRGQQKLLRNGYIYIYIYTHIIYVHRRILSEGSSVFIGKKGKIMPTSSSHKLLCTELRNISDGVAANLPSLEALCKNVCHLSRQNHFTYTSSQRRNS